MSSKTPRAWLKRALDARARALASQRAAERRKHVRAAIDALLVAASLGERPAFVQLGAYYRDNAPGLTPGQTDIAEHWFRLGATAGDPEAMLALGALLLDLGRRTEGRRWLGKALALGNGRAARRLGKELEEKSPSRALRWYLKGADLGDPPAAYFAGKLLERRGSRPALQQAAKLYERAARKRVRDATPALERVRRRLRGEALNRFIHSRFLRTPPP